MDYSKNVESTLNALLLNAQLLQDANPLASLQLADEQKRLLDALFNQWGHLSEDERKALLATQVESKALALAEKNKACLRKI